MKKVLIPWSGGLDSTTLVYNNLKEGNTVVPVYLTIENNENKVKKELEVLDKLKSVLDGKISRGELPGRLERIESDVRLSVAGCPNLSLAQIPVWITGLLYTEWHGVDEIQVGYVMNDDAISYIPDFKKMFNSYKSIVHDELSIPKLTFPLVKTKKRICWDTLPHEVRQLTVFCENPSGGNDCGHCVSCQRSKNDGLFSRYERNWEDAVKEEIVEEEIEPMEYALDCDITEYEVEVEYKEGHYETDPEWEDWE